MSWEIWLGPLTEWVGLIIKKYSHVCPWNLTDIKLNLLTLFSLFNAYTITQFPMRQCSVSDCHIIMIAVSIMFLYTIKCLRDIWATISIEACTYQDVWFSLTLKNYLQNHVVAYLTHAYQILHSTCRITLHDGSLVPYLCRTTLVLSNEVVLSCQGIPFKNTRLFIHRAPHHFWYELFYDSMELEFSIIKCYEYVFFNAWEYPSRFNHIQYQKAHADSRSSSLVQLKSKTST